MSDFHAICVGITTYDNIPNVPRAALQATEIHRRLVARGVMSALLTNREATRDAFLAAFRRFERESTAGDHLFVYFNGHGKEDVHAGIEADGSPFEALVMSSRDDVLDRDLAEALGRLSDRRVFMVLDACNAGGMPPLRLNYLRSASGGRGTIEAWLQVIAAAETGELATANTSTGSPLTNGIISVLDRPQPAATYQELFDLVCAAMPADAQRPVYLAAPAASAQQPFRLGQPPTIASDDVQAHVLFGFPQHQHTRLVFFGIKDPLEFKKVIGGTMLVPTSAAAYGTSGRQLAMGIALSHAGLELLQATELPRLGEHSRAAPGARRASWGAKPNDGAHGAATPKNDPSIHFEPHPALRQPTFQRGIEYASSAFLGDPWDEKSPGSFARWTVKTTPERPLHGVLLLAHAVDTEAQTAVDLLTKEIGGVLDIITVERGYRPQDRKEHFGFRDGISTPGLFGRMTSDGDFAPIPRGATSFHAVDELLVQGDKVPAWARNGSFLVYRRLNQEVGRFATAVKTAAGKLALKVDAAAATLVGRDANGVSLARRGPGAAPGSRRALDDFDYSDPAGACPAYAHARKVNPRDAARPTPPLFRRGLLFGTQLPAGAEDDGKQERGLHFLCYQSSIEAQFEVVTRWMNESGPPGASDGVDALVGRSANGGPRPFPSFHLPDFVVPTGGEYFFAPSLSGLRALGSKERQR